ncbi:MAG: GNAT family N-acetyltransferase [Ruminococcus albus]|nr:GNAT family N-acetyltransferase [Ruminococcus albus]
MVNIRRAVRSDSESLERLYTQLEKDAVYYQPEHFVMSGKGARISDGLFESDTQAVYVAEVGGEVVGFVHILLMESKNIACLKREKNVYIQDMVVDEKYRSKGTGTLLMGAVKQYGRDHGASFVRTQVFPKNEDGLRFYRRNGFEVTMLTVEVPLG